MSAPVFIGDDVSAAAYRLAGARTRVPAVEETSEVFDEACAESDLVLLSAEFAQYLPAEKLAHARTRKRPLLLLVPDVQGRVPVPDLAKQLRTRLGVGG